MNDSINKIIPTPSIKKVPCNTLGKPWWLQFWIYIAEPTEYQLYGEWKISLPNGMFLSFPDGFVFDGASIPWFLRWFITSWGPLLRAAIIHDFGYRHKFYFTHHYSIFYESRPRKFFDDIFKEVIIWTTGAKWLAYPAWWGVRLFGWIAWRKHRKNE